MLLRFAKEFENENKRQTVDNDSELKYHILQRLSESANEDNEDFEYLKIKEKPQFDCQSILSTYSNIYNRPKLIQEPNVS